MTFYMHQMAHSSLNSDPNLWTVIPKQSVGLQVLGCGLQVFLRGYYSIHII